MSAYKALIRKLTLLLFFLCHLIMASAKGLSALESLERGSTLLSVRVFSLIILQEKVLSINPNQRSDAPPMCPPPPG